MIQDSNLSKLISIYKSRIFLLGDEKIDILSLLHWSEAVKYYLDHGVYKEGFDFAIKVYLGEKLGVFGLPDNKYSPEISQKLQEILSEFISEFMKEPREKNVESMTSVVLDTCIVIEAWDLLFGDVLDLMAEHTQEDIYFEALEIRILSGKIVDITNPTAMQSFMDYFMSKDLFNRLEQLIIQLNTENMDINHIISVCEKARMNNALIYLYNVALKDYISPLKILLAHSQKKSDSSFIVFMYLSCVLNGMAFPDKILDLEQANSAKCQIYGFLFSSAASQVLEENNEMTNHPIFFNLLDLDPDDMLKLLARTMEDNQLDTGFHISSYSTDILVNRQFIVNAIISLITPKLWNQRVIDSLINFVFRCYSSFRRFLIISEKQITSFIDIILSSDCEETHSQREAAMLALYDTGFPLIDTVAYLKRIETSQFWRLCEKHHLHRRDYVKSTECYFKDNSRRHEIFAKIRYWHDHEMDHSQMIVIKEYLKSNLNTLVEIDSACTALMIEYLWPMEHVEFIRGLNGALKYAYLKGLLDSAEKRPENVELYDLFVQLLASNAKGDLVRFMEKNDGYFTFVKAFEIAKTHRAIDAIVWCLERSCRYQEAVTTQIEAFEDIVTQEDYNSNIVKCVELCIRSRAYVQNEWEMDELWILILKKVQKFDVIDPEIIQKLVSYVSLEVLMKHVVLNLPSSEGLGQHRLKLSELLKAATYKLQTYEIAANICMKRIYGDFAALVRFAKIGIISGYYCNGCNEKLLVDLGESKPITLVKCSHSFHQSCFLTECSKCETVDDTRTKGKERDIAMPETFLELDLRINQSLRRDPISLVSRLDSYSEYLLSNRTFQQFRG
jgi:hypothetical protein